MRLDVYLKDEDGIVYNIEMQMTSLGEKEFAKRFRYYEAMIDSYLLKVGQDYKYLNKLFIVFICPFRIFDSKRSIYTFKNFCEEDKSIQLKDNITKIFITTKSKDKKNLSEDFQALLKYIDGIKTENSFVNQIENKINQIKQDEIERGAYMQYDLHLRDIEEEARAEGEKIGMANAIINNIKSLMETMNVTAEKAMNALKIPQEEQSFYLAKLEPIS
ncbi:Rpn family recombination-promoting nuclease/putative transposase [bacterium]|nr:Rpn family recombination-promoting nuclease/putative transposase [bacterium]